VLSNGVIAVGWGNIGDLNDFDSPEALKRKLAQKDNGLEASQDARLVRILPLAFKVSIHSNDLVVCPDRKTGGVHVGRVLSERAFYDPLLWKASVRSHTGGKFGGFARWVVAKFGRGGGRFGAADGDGDQEGIGSAR